MGTPSNPGWPTGYDPSAAEWTAAWQSKADYPVPVGQGGSGLTSTPTAGQFLIGTGSGFRLGYINAGAGISVTNADGSVTISSSSVTPDGNNYYLGAFPDDSSANSFAAAEGLIISSGFLYFNTSEEKIRVSYLGSWSDYDSSAQAAEASAEASAATATAAVNLAAGLTAVGLPYQNTASTYVPQGVAAFSLTSGGSGGTNGTNILATFTGGMLTTNPTIYFDIVGGIVANVRMASPGLYIGTGTPTMPTVALPGSAGGAALTLTAGKIIPNGGTYWAWGMSGSQALFWQNSGGVPVAFPPGAQGQAYFPSVDLTSFSQSSFSYVAYGSDGNLLFGVQSGTYPGFVVDGIVENNPIHYPKSSLNLGGTLVGYTGGGGDWSQANRAWVLMGSDFNELGGVDSATFPQPTGAFSPHRNAKPEYVAHPTNGWELFTRRDSNNCMQVWSRNVSLGVSAVKLSEAGADNITPHFDATGNRAVWNTSNQDRWFSNQLRARLLSGSAPVGHAYPSLYETVIGDSIANGTGATTTANAFAYLTAAALGLTMNMRAVGGQQVWQQAMIFGAIPTVLTLASTSITTAGVNVSAISTVHPATGATPSCTVQGLSGVSLYPNTLLLSSGANASTNTLNATMVDASGNTQPVVLNRTANAVPSTVETYTLSSNAGVTITAASTTVTIVPTGPSTGQSPNGIAIGDQHNAVMIYEGGINDFSQGIFATNITPPAAATIATDIEAVQDAIIALNASAVQAFAVVGVYNPASSWAIAGSAGDLAIAAFNANRTAKYPGRFVNAFAILAAGNNGSTQDLSDVANHYIPTSERYDVTHPNNTGHANIANGNSGGAGVISVLAAQIAAIPTS